MMDNNAAGGSTGQGGLELNSLVTAGFSVAFNAFPIDAAGAQGNIVQIVGFEISSGPNVFGNWGYPAQQATGPYQWLATAMAVGKCIYQVKVGVSVGGSPWQYFWWDTFLNCTA